MHRRPGINVTVSLSALLIVCAVGCDQSRVASLPKRESAERFDTDVANFKARVAEHTTSDLTPLVRVVAEDTGEPVHGVFVELTLTGPDGGDGGFQHFLTDSDGIARTWFKMYPGRYQPHIRPRPGSKYAFTEWRRGEPYIAINDAGKTDVPDLVVRAGN